MSKLKFEEIVSPQDNLTSSIDMIKGGMASYFSLCLTGCITGKLEPKDKDKDNETSKSIKT